MQSLSKFRIYIFISKAASQIRCMFSILLNKPKRTLSPVAINTNQPAIKATYPYFGISIDFIFDATKVLKRLC